MSQKNKLSPEKMSENLTKFYDLIIKYITGDRKEKLVLFYRSIEDSLVMSPGGVKLEQGNCFPGGYLDRLIAFVDAALVMDKVWDKFGQEKTYTLEELVFAALNVDLGKLGYKDQPYYLPNDVQWQIEKQGALYKYNFDIPHMRIVDRSLFVLQQAGIQMSENEYLAIKLHDGLYEDSNHYYLVTGPDLRPKSNLPYILHQADILINQIKK